MEMIKQETLESVAGLLSYASHRVPEISDEIYRLMRPQAGFWLGLAPLKFGTPLG